MIVYREYRSLYTSMFCRLVSHHWGYLLCFVLFWYVFIYVKIFICLVTMLWFKAILNLFKFNPITKKTTCLQRKRPCLYLHTVVSFQVFHYTWDMSVYLFQRQMPNMSCHQYSVQHMLPSYELVPPLTLLLHDSQGVVWIVEIWWIILGG